MRFMTMVLAYFFCIYASIFTFTPVAQAARTRAATTNTSVTQAATAYYVAPNGQDSNQGTLQSPFATLSKAANKVKAGDSILLRGGTYKLKEGVWIGSTGTPNARINIASYPGEKAVFDGSAIPNDDSANCISIGGAYIDVSGIECHSAPRAGIVVWCGHDVRIMQNTVHHTGIIGIFSMCDKPNIIQNIQVDSNTVYQTNLDNQARNTNGGWGSGISVIGGSDILFSNNQVYQNYGEGIGCYDSVRCTVRSNKIYDNYSVNLYIASSADVISENNLIYNTGNVSFFRNIDGVWGPAVGIQLGDENCSDSLILKNIIVRNNIVLNGRSGFYYGNYICPNAGMKNTQVVNNTFYASTEALLKIDSSSGSNGNTIANNIFYQINKKPMTEISDRSSMTYQKNLWYGGTASIAASKSDIIADPQFINAGSTNANDYRLKQSSPAIDVGMPTSTVTNDYFGINRPQGKGFDIGAREFY